MSWIQLLLPGVLAALATILATPRVIALALRLRAIDEPGGRKRHVRPVPRLGGLAISFGIAIALVIGLAWTSPAGFASFVEREIVGFGLALTLILLVGTLDDIYRLSALHKLSVQLIAAALVVSMGWQFRSIRLPFEGTHELGAFLAPALSLLWIVGVTNAINLLDGMDGLAAGVVAMISACLLVLALIAGSTETVVVTSAITGACLGFLRHNWRPARIFMGDSGSLFLGFLLAAISIRATPSMKAPTAAAILAPLLALGLPVIDTVLVMWARFLRGHTMLNRVASVFRADRAHIHHLLEDASRNRRPVLFILFGIAALFCAMAVGVAASSSWQLGVGFFVLQLSIVILVRRSGMRRQTRDLARKGMLGISRRGADHDLFPEENEARLARLPPERRSER